MHKIIKRLRSLYAYAVYAGATKSITMVVLASDKRWLVTLYALNKIVAPDLKDVVKQGMNTLSVNLDGRLTGLATPCTLKTLTYGVVNPPKTTLSYSSFLKGLKFGNINSNFDIHGDDKAAYNYSVNNLVDVAKLYLPDYLAVFSAFDKSMDVAAALRLLGCRKYPLQIFSSSNPLFDIWSLADDVRANVRNKGDHFKELEWTETFFDECFDKLNTLVQCLPLTPGRKDDLLDQLSEWRTEGFKKIVDEDVKDLLENFQNGQLETINEKLDRIATREEEVVETVTKKLGTVEDLLHTVSSQLRDHFRRNGTSVSPTNATLSNGCETRDEENGVTCHVSESSVREELENPSTAVEDELPENQRQLEANESPQIIPNQVPLKFPKSPFCIILKENLKEDSGKARFQELGEVKLHKVAVNKFLGDILPESPREGLFKVTIESQNGDFLGETEIMYLDIVEQVLKNVVTYQENMPMFIRAALPYLNVNSGRGSCDTPNSIRAGISGEQKTSLSVQLLLRLLYKAAEVNAKWFIHLIFNLPAGRIAFDSYKETSWLPEDVASSQGHEEIAQYLRDVKKRFSLNEEGREGRSKDIDWQEIMDAIEPTETEIMDVDEDLCGMSQLKIAQGAGTTTIPESKEDESFHMICNPITEEAKVSPTLKYSIVLGVSGLGVLEQPYARRGGGSSYGAPTATKLLTRYYADYYDIDTYDVVRGGLLSNAVAAKYETPLSLEIAVNYIRNVEVDMQDEDDIRMKIRRCPLLLFDENESGVYIRVHQVTHDAVSNVVGRNTQEREVIVLKAIVKALFQFVEDYKLNDPNDLNSVVKGTRTVPHLRTLVKAIRQTYSKENVSEVAENDIFHTSSTLYFNKLAETCYKYFKFAEAKEYYELSSRIQVKTLGPEHVDVAKRYNSLGIIHRNLGKLGEAKEFYDRALAIRLKKLGPDHVDVASTYENLGNVHCNLGELSQAKEFYDRALAIRLKKLGPDHVDVAKTYANMGSVHYNLVELSQAKEFYDRALAIRLKKRGPDHVDLANTYNNLGCVHSNLGELSQAKEFHHRALAICLKKLGPDHVDVASTYENLGNVHRNLGELSQAKEFYDRALAIRLKQLGPHHVDVAKTYANLGNVHSNLGELSQAKEFYDRALAIRLKKLGPDHVDVAWTLDDQVH
ncbi:Nephrocystin-3 [Stylophora pistillata]|uniref:Nephrocystin-3 n=1 Tax=Stylophora pistillata TaxID=50429 RepID=A0A2B4SAH9_STYPI|nr:Nephrocystin-3 [Stylophora pistillata]